MTGAELSRLILNGIAFGVACVGAGLAAGWWSFAQIVAVIK